MPCPSCGKPTNVTDKRNEGFRIKRRRKCSICQMRFVTYEYLDSTKFKIVKKNGDIEKYSRDKLKRGILMAVYKRGIDEHMVNDIVDVIEVEIFTRKNHALTTSVLGSLVLTQLRKIDIVAFIRFASVYENYTSIEQFIYKINNL